MEFDLKQLNDAVYRYPSETGEEGDRGPQIVFIHGLQPQESKSPYFEPWLTEDGRELWPKSWLSEKFPTAAMYLVHYDSCPRKDGKKGMMDMYVTAEYLLENLLLAKVGQSPRNPVILVGHDIGGLVIKEICLRAFSGASSGLKSPMVCKKRQFLTQVKGIFYFSTPHGGFHHLDPEGQGELMANLTVHNPFIARSNEEFRKKRMEYKWTAYGLGASHSLPGQVEVKEASGRYDVDDFCMIGASSMDICRFKDRTSTSFQTLENFIQDTVSGFKNPDRVELRFKADPHYVPLERTVREIRQTLERPDIQVVVLWGDAGTGKSSLVKYLALQYEEMGSNAAFWDGIFYFECGHGADALSIIRQMLRELNENEETISASGEDQKRLEFLLRKRLQNLNALMIVDDVWDHHRRSLVEKVVFPGAKEVKYLVTSQQSDVWEGYATCQIEGVNRKVAREIIVKNIRVDPKDDIWREPNIPEEDEEIVNEIIDATDFHPLALATIASSVKVDKRGRVPRAEWQELKRNLLSYLADEEEGARAVAFGTSYPSSVYVAMMNAVNVLHGKNDDCLHLLCILALFKSPLPTSVLHMFMLCTSEPQVSSQVSRLVKRLQGRKLAQEAYAPDRDLVQRIFFTDPYQSIIQSTCLKLHSLRQKFVLRCAEFQSNSQRSVRFIKGILGPFLRQTSTSDGGAHGSEPSEGHDNPSALSTALCALYGVEEVQIAAYNKLICNSLLKLPVPETAPFESSISRFTLEILLGNIEEQCTSPRILSALQKVLLKYIFQTQIDDDNIWILISEGYYCPLFFLIYTLEFNGKRPCEMITRSSMSRYVVEAMKLLRTEVQPSLQILPYVLSLLQSLASRIDESYPSSIIDAFDLEVLINLLLHHIEQSLVPRLLLQILSDVTRIERVKFRWISLLRTRPSLQKVIESVIESSVADLNSEDVHWLELELEELLPNFTILKVVESLRIVELLSELETFGDEKVAATVKSISKPIQAVARSFQQSPEIFNSDSLGAFQSIILNPVQGIRSVVWSLPGVIEGIVSVVCRVKSQRRSQPEVTSAALCILLECIRLHDGARYGLFSHRGFLDVLLEVIRDHREEVHPEHALESVRARWSDGIATPVMASLQNWLRWELPHFYGVQILEAFLTSDIDGTAAAAAPDWASLSELHPALSDLLGRYTDEDVRLQRSVLTILLYLGYNIFGRNEMTSCSHLRAVTPQHFQRADLTIRSRALNVQNGLENLLDVILKGQSNVKRLTAVDLLLHLLNHSSVRARVYGMPEAATGLALLLDDDGVDVQELALEAILVLSKGSETDLAMEFIRRIVLVPGIVERIVEFTRDDWDRKHEFAIRFVDRYLDVDSGNSSHISAVQGMVGDMVMSMKNEHQNAHKISCTLEFLDRFSRDSRNLLFFLSITGSVEAVVELVPHYTRELQLGGSEKERTERVRLTGLCFELLWKIANASEGANFRIARSGRLLDLTLNLLDKRQQESVQVGTLKFLADLAERSSHAVFEMTEHSGFIEKLSFLLHSVDREKWIWPVTEFAFRLARQNVFPEKIGDLMRSALQDSLQDLQSLLSLVTNHQPLGYLLVSVPGVLQRLISLSLHHPQGSARAYALLILKVSLDYVFTIHEEVFSLCLFKVLDALPEILSQLERPDSVVVQSSIVLLLELLARLLVRMGNNCDHEITSSRLRTELVSLTLYNSQVLENLTGLLQRDEPECRHEDVMFFLGTTATITHEGMSRILGIPGALERIVQLVYRGNRPASIFLLSLTSGSEFRASPPRYLLKCLAHVASTEKGRYIVQKSSLYVACEALRHLGLCARQNNYALGYLVDMLHKNIRYELLAEAMNYLVRFVSDSNQEPLGRTVFVSLRSSDYDLVIDDNSEPVYDPHIDVRCILDSLVSRGRHHRLRLAKCVTGIYAHDLQMKTIDAPTVKRGRSTASSEGLHHGFARPPFRRQAKHTKPGLLSLLDPED